MMEQEKSLTEKVRRAGRPTEWTEDLIDIMIKDLDEWVDLPTSICLSGFRAYQGITDNIFSHLIKNSSKFAQAYNLAKLTLSNRLAQCVGNKVHVVHYNKYKSYYDSEIKGHEKEMASIKAEIVDEQQKEAEEKAIAISSKIAEQMSKHLEKGKS